jgi:hypothetical protein
MRRVGFWNTEFGALPMQLADHVERNCIGQSATQRPPANPVVAAVTGLALLPRFHQPRLAFLRVYLYECPSPNSQQRCNDAECL